MKISMFSTHEMKYIWYLLKKGKFSFYFILFLEDLQLINVLKIVNEYDQEIPQSQTADNPVAP